MMIRLKEKLSRVNWVLVLYLQGIIALLIWLAISLCGCVVVNDRTDVLVIVQDSIVSPNVTGIERMEK